MEKLNKYIKDKNREISNSNYTFESLFEIIHNQDNRNFSEYMELYKVKKVSYNDFESYIKKMASYLKKNILEPKGSYVGILMENCHNWLACFWGLLMIGYNPLLINAKLPLFMNNDVIKMVNCNKIVTDDSFENYKLDCDKLVLNKTIGLSEDILNENEIEKGEWANEIAITSTATSLHIKLCVYTGKDFTHQMLNNKYILSENKMMKKTYKGSIKQLTFLPFYHVFGLIATYFWFAVFGRSFVFLSDYSSNTILKTIRKHEVTHVFAVPLLWHTMYKEIRKQVNGMDEKVRNKFEKGVKLSLSIQNVFPKLGQKIASKLFKEVQEKTFGPSISFMISGGGYISYDAIKTLNAIGYPLYNGYGSTEIGITSVELRNKAKHRIASSIGKPFPSVEYKIENEQLLVKGESICSKIYTVDGEKDIDHNEWYNTKDLVNEVKGYYFVNGRTDDIYVGFNGEKINPDAIEKELHFSTLNHYVVLGLEKNNKKELALVIEIPRNTNDVILRKILLELQDNVANLKNMNYQLDNVYYSFDPICNVNAIKVSRKALQKLIDLKQVNLDLVKNLDLEKIKDKELLSREICDNVKQVMANILGKDVSEINDNSHFIFDLGGTSLDYCTLLIELKKIYETEFDLKEQSFSNAIDFSNYIIKKNK